MFLKWGRAWGSAWIGHMPVVWAAPLSLSLSLSLSPLGMINSKTRDSQVDGEKERKRNEIKWSESLKDRKKELNKKK